MQATFWATGGVATGTPAVAVQRGGSSGGRFGLLITAAVVAVPVHGRASAIWCRSVMVHAVFLWTRVSHHIFDGDVMWSWSVAAEWRAGVVRAAVTRGPCGAFGGGGAGGVGLRSWRGGAPGRQSGGAATVGERGAEGAVGPSLLFFPPNRATTCCQWVLGRSAVESMGKGNTSGHRLGAP